MKSESVRYEIFHNCPCGDKILLHPGISKPSKDFRLLVDDLNLINLSHNSVLIVLAMLDLYGTDITKKPLFLCVNDYFVGARMSSRRNIDRPSNFDHTAHAINTIVTAPHAVYNSILNKHTLMDNINRIYSNLNDATRLTYNDTSMMAGIEDDDFNVINTKDTLIESCVNYKEKEWLQSTTSDLHQEFF